MLFETTDEMALNVAKRFQRIRKIKKVTQEELAKISNVSFGSIKRFETSGEISLHSLIKLCVALNLVQNITDLFSDIPYQSIEEVIRDARKN